MSRLAFFRPRLPFPARDFNPKLVSSIMRRLCSARSVRFITTVKKFHFCIWRGCLFALLLFAFLLFPSFHIFYLTSSMPPLLFSLPLWSSLRNDYSYVAILATAAIFYYWPCIIRISHERLLTYITNKHRYSGLLFRWFCHCRLYV